MTDSAMQNRPSVRRATITDFEKILDMHQNIYDGNDYIPALFYTYIQNPEYHLYVMEHNGQLISFVVLRILEGGKVAASLAGRVRPSYQKRHFGPPRSFELRVKVLQDFPQMTDILFIAPIDIANRIIQEGQGEIYYQWKTISFRLTASDISSIINRGSSSAKHLSYDNAINLLTSGERIQNLIKRYATKYIPHGAAWVPGFINSEELRKLVISNTTFISYGPRKDGGLNPHANEVIAFSYNTIIPIKHGSLAVIFYYGEFENLIDHLLAHLRHLYTVFDRTLTIYYHMPLGIDSLSLNTEIDALKLSDCEKFEMANNNQYILGSLKLNAFRALL